MVLPLIPVIGIVLDVLVIGVDYYYSSVLMDAGSQLEHLLMSIETGATFEDFISQCWMFLVLGFFVLWAGLSLAFPKHRKVRE